MTWNTPNLLKAGGVAVTFTALLLMLAVIEGARSHRHQIQVIGRDCAPSIVAAQHIAAALADMDATAADSDSSNFDRRRTEAATAIITAAENITFGDAERIPIQKLAIGLAAYSAAVVRNVRQAQNIMDNDLLPAAAALDEANRKELEAVWAEQKTASERSLSLMIVAGILLGGVLLALQVFLAQRMRRTLNPGLFGATVAAWLFVVFAAQSFNTADRDLKVAKEDAFDSVIALWQARSVAYSANGDLRRALLDPANAAVHQKAFGQKNERVLRYIDDELKNITFPGELEVAEAMKSAYWAKDFAKFDAALGTTLKINQDEFERAIDRGFRDVANFEIIAPFATLAICVLAWVGLRPRLREYSL
jgi:hypothetical protein